MSNTSYLREYAIIKKKYQILLKKQTFNDLLKCTEYDIVELIDNGTLILIQRSRMTNVIKYLIDNSIELNCTDIKLLFTLEYYLKKISLREISVKHYRLMNEKIIKFLIDHNIKI